MDSHSSDWGIDRSRQSTNDNGPISVQVVEGRPLNYRGATDWSDRLGTIATRHRHGDVAPDRAAALRRAGGGRDSQHLQLR